LGSSFALTSPLFTGVVSPSRWLRALARCVGVRCNQRAPPTKLASSTENVALGGRVLCWTWTFPLLDLGLPSPLVLTRAQEHLAMTINCLGRTSQQKMYINPSRAANFFSFNDPLKPLDSQSSYYRDHHDFQRPRHLFLRTLPTHTRYVPLLTSFRPQSALGSVVALGPAPVNLRSAVNCAILAETGVSIVPPCHISKAFVRMVG